MVEPSVFEESSGGELTSRLDPVLGGVKDKPKHHDSHANASSVCNGSTSPPHNTTATWMLIFTPLVE